MSKPRIGIVISTTREGRFGDKPAAWIYDIAAARGDLAVEIVDLREYPMPLFAEAASPAYVPPQDETAQRWGQKVAELDGFIFVTAEYNRAPPAALKNALDYAYTEFNRKPAAFIGYGGVGGARAVEQLRLICIELQMAPTRSGVHIGGADFIGMLMHGKTFADMPHLEATAADMLEELAWWTNTLKGPRAETASPESATPEAELLEKYKEERARRIRPEGVGQFLRTDGEFAHFLEDPYAEKRLSRLPVEEKIDVVVVGGGWSGILAARSLRQAGVDDIRIIETGADFGGVWYWNRYPGCRCDLDSYIYMPYIEEVGYMPSEKYATADEIRNYAHSICKRFDLYRHAMFQTQVTEVRWDEEQARWIVSTNRGDRLKARFLFVGNGALNYPKLPGIPGIESFKGHSFHTSRWDYDYTGGDPSGNLVKLKDKRVAMIGTGCSGIQCAAPLSEWSEQLYVVQRTPAVVGYRGNRPTDPDWAKSVKPGWTQARMVNFDGILAGIIRDEDIVGDEWTDFWAPPPPSDPNSDPAEAAAAAQRLDIEKMERVRARIDSIVKEPATAESLKPYYSRFCKRPTFNDDYLPVFNRANVKLVDTRGRGLDRITENAVVFDGRSYEVDCIIYATGFELLTISHKAGGFEIIGRNGQTIDQKWSQAVRTLHGIYAHGFPNLFFVAGMRQSAPTINFPHMVGEQARHAAAVVRRMLDADVKIMDVTPQAEADWANTIAAKSKVNIEYIKACTPSYINSEGNLTELSKQPVATAYGGGPFEYFAILNQWRERGFADDLQLVYEKDPCAA